ncbi:ABC transporter substrate-binding protein [Bradyrhizobium sp. LHD-71]|uniref:ABC transporter substrate-binding protein n=1 Tax=Bradyrhizobium sp. LHD-71 TaxID=3072141 RepID=UPI00280F0404|nr:ABC transporter substrate-binding protein [Bradyrhizobium sp. LHD-71]MDQ8727338.1 ABC transporter substrate-binding protein [Bradyrhizobium sp. LHD-71]
MKLTNGLSALALVGLAASAPVAAQEKPASLGFGIFTFTSGPAAAYGMPGKNAADLMIEEINAKGGIEGVPVSATYVDEAQGAQGVIAEYRRLAGDAKNQVMIAALSSANCLALAPIAEQLEVPTVGWNCDTHQLLMDGKSKYVFRPNGNTVPEFIAYAIYLLERKPDVKTIAIINPDYAFGHDAAKIFTAALKALKPDVQVVAELFPKLGSPNYQTEISRLTTARPDVVFSNLWGADLENFVRQAAPRGLFTSSQVILALGETVLQRVPLPDGVIVGVLGDGWWMSPDAKANAETAKFAESYKARFGEYPVFPSIKMANTLIYVKAAYKAAMQKNGGKWPTRAELADAMKGSKVATLTGTTQTRADNDGLVDQIVGVTMKAPAQPFPVIGEMVRYKGDSLMPQAGQDPLAWISMLKPEFAKSLPKPGSYK